MIDPEPSIASWWTESRVTVAICTYRRPELLDRLLRSLSRLHESVGSPATMSVVVVDDSPDGEAKVVTDSTAAWSLRVARVELGSQNISMARNTALESALVDSDWVAFLDDDCEPSADWLDNMFAVQRQHDADIVTSGVRYRADPGAPRWLEAQGFIEAFDPYDEGSVPEHGCMANVLLRSEWFRRPKAIRFSGHLGLTGGEDMLFLDGATEAGATMRWSSRGLVIEWVPRERSSYRYMLYRSFWFGNNTVLVNLETGWTERPRLFLRLGKKTLLWTLNAVLALGHPRRFHARKRLADLGYLIGTAFGLLGVRVKHR